MDSQTIRQTNKLTAILGNLYVYAAFIENDSISESGKTLHVDVPLVLMIYFTNQ